MRPKRETKKNKGFFFGLFLLFAGFTGGMAVAGGLAVYFSELPLPLITPPTRDGGRDIAKFRERERRETLEFHDLLRQDRRNDPDIPGLEAADDSPSAAPRESDAPAQPAAKVFVYHLQIGAFKNRDSAENLRGQMALNGREAAVSPDNPAAPALWRVRLGPFADERTAEEQRALLALEGYNNVSLLKTVSQKR